LRLVIPSDDAQHIGSARVQGQARFHTQETRFLNRVNTHTAGIPKFLSSFIYLGSFAFVHRVLLEARCFGRDAASPNVRFGVESGH